MSTATISLYLAAVNIDVQRALAIGQLRFLDCHRSHRSVPGLLNVDQHSSPESPLIATTNPDLAPAPSHQAQGTFYPGCPERLNRSPTILPLAPSNTLMVLLRYHPPQPDPPQNGHTVRFLARDKRWW